MNTISRAAAASLFAAAMACQPTPAAPPAPPASPAQPSPTHTTGSAPSASACAPFEDLNAMDTRTPVPLQPMMAWHQKQNMMEHLVAIQRVTDALSREDWGGVAEAAELIESSPQMETMCRHMGSGAPGFTELALEFHRAADAIAPAAAQEDTAAVLRATSSTLQVCTSCHAAYRQDVVSASGWRARTGESHAPSHHPR